MKIAEMFLNSEEPSAINHVSVKYIESAVTFTRSFTMQSL